MNIKKSTVTIWTIDPSESDCTTEEAAVIATRFAHADPKPFRIMVNAAGCGNSFASLLKHEHHLPIDTYVRYRKPCGELDMEIHTT